MMTEDLKLDDIMARDGGQDYFISIYPELALCFENKNKKVKLREEDKTASASVFKHRTANLWLLKDFGDGADSKAITAFELCKQVNRCDSGEAFKILAAFYGFSLQAKTAQASYSSRLPKTNEQAGQILNLVYKAELELSDCQTIFSRYAWEGMEWAGVRAKDDQSRLEAARLLCQYYRFKPLHQYEQVAKDGDIVHIYTANEGFPMFAIDEGDFQKIYKPKGEKAYRFMWVGQKPEHYTHGLKQHKNYIDSNVKSNEKKYNEAAEGGKELADGEMLPEKIREIVLCSGGSDAINVAALGYRVVWMNSETAKLDKDSLKTIYKISHDFYNLPDIDMTGRAAAKALAWRHIDIKTVWLSAELATKSDRKGGLCKDVRDYLNFYKAESFKTLVKNSLPFKFWDEMPKLDKDGDQVFKFGRPVSILEFNNVRGYNFLQMNGFWCYENNKYKEGYHLIKIDGNIVSNVLGNEVKNFIHLFLKERQMSEDLRNVMYRSPQLNEQSLSNLETIELDFKHYGHDFQYIFFEKKTWKVTAAGIEAVKMPNIYVWKDRILKPKNQKGIIEGFAPKIVSQFFSITENDGEWDVKFDNLDCDYLKFMVQSCRIHWRIELEGRMEYFALSNKEKEAFLIDQNLDADMDNLMMYMAKEDNQEKYKNKYQFSLEGSLLTEAERKEQKLAFVNRIFGIGYLLHRYKDPTKPWAAFVMDYSISEDGVSNGRAGKGLLAMALKFMLSHFWVDARDEKLFDNSFLFGGVDKGNELIHMEDWHEYLNFERLFNVLTGSLYSNAKGMQPVTIENQDFGKILIDTNYSDRYMSGSAKGRKLWMVFANFYHEDLENYREVRTPLTELGHRMFDDWSEAEWNNFYNFMAQCLQFYLSVADKSIKIDPPFANIIKRNSLAIMGENFRQWADTYFDGHMNESVERKIAFEDYAKTSNQQKTSPQAFFKKLIAWADFMNYKINPEHVPGWCKAGEGKKYGYIKRSMPKFGEPNKYSTIEYVYIENLLTESPAAPQQIMPF